MDWRGVQKLFIRSSTFKHVVIALYNTVVHILIACKVGWVLFAKVEILGRRKENLPLSIILCSGVDILSDVVSFYR